MPADGRWDLIRSLNYFVHKKILHLYQLYLENLKPWTNCSSYLFSSSKLSLYGTPELIIWSKLNELRNFKPRLLRCHFLTFQTSFTKSKKTPFTETTSIRPSVCCLVWAIQSFLWFSWNSTYIARILWKSAHWQSSYTWGIHELITPRSIFLGRFGAKLATTDARQVLLLSIIS
jgi:hypothetical protein